MKKKVLVLCPPPTAKGGVADYNRLLRDYFTSEEMTLDFYYTGNTAITSSPFQRISKTLTDLRTLIATLSDYDLIVFNPSLDPRAVLRDGIFHLVAKNFFLKKTVVFFHGWTPEFEDLIDKFGIRLFRFFFNFDKGLVLGSRFRNTFIKWGYHPDAISVETTTYEFRLASRNKDRNKILFMSRFAEGKGGLEAIKTIQIVSKQFPLVKLYMAGDGEQTRALKEYVACHGLAQHVEFTGWLRGEDKYSLLNQCGIMLFPTFYGEGLPISIIEGMGVGMAVVTRPVGGITDIVVDGENGFVVSSHDPAQFAHKVKLLLEDHDTWQAISRRNIEKALARYEVRKVVKRLEEIYYNTACGCRHAQ